MTNALNITEEEIEIERRVAVIEEEGRQRRHAALMAGETQLCLAASKWIRDVAGETHYMTPGCIGWRVKNGDISVEWLESELDGSPAGYVKYHLMSFTPSNGGRHEERWYKGGKRCEDIEAAVYEMIERSGEGSPK